MGKGHGRKVVRKRAYSITFVQWDGARQFPAGRRVRSRKIGPGALWHASHGP
ncbi:Hypothetical protein AA314_08367 [Archangium gephyra]|uniref:Uncharacterized protein n=1 Tax=Archangium gephyra TaxID=48 RepID=A0AAC8QGP1_9BACT|nr:Hypothetical protein AA314_08367 [Archangium gephyra]